MHEFESALTPNAAVGSCRVCAYEPVAFAARTCPNCGANNPNPGVCDRFAGRGMLIGLFGGVVAGGVGGYFARPDGSVPMTTATAGALAGAIAGLIVGLVGGLMLAGLAWVAGKR